MRYCQFGEEDQLLAFFQQEGFGNKMLCDIGARLEYSNSAMLIEEHEFRGKLIEQSPPLCDELRKKFPHMEVICKTVDLLNVNDLVPEHCDFLNIDIDSNDGWLFLNLRRRPRLIVIETTDIEGFHLGEYTDKGRKNEFGISEEVLRVFADLKGYRIAGKTGVNCFLVPKKCSFSFPNNNVRERTKRNPRNVLAN